MLFWVWGFFYHGELRLQARKQGTEVQGRNMKQIVPWQLHTNEQAVCLKVWETNKLCIERQAFESMRKWLFFVQG